MNELLKGAGVGIRSGEVRTISLTSDAIKGNLSGENHKRDVSIYLPPGYETSGKRYPVIYWLHGFGSSDKVWMERRDLKGMLDFAIATDKIREVIVVVANQQTRLGGSFYVNSKATGNWEDFTVKELVDYVDRTFRTIDDKTARGLAGHSMGGNGAIRLGMKYPDIFSAIYAMSPAALAFERDINLHNDYFKIAARIRSWEEVSTSEGFMMIWAIAQAYSPSASSLPFFAELPVFVDGANRLKVREEIAEKWYAELPLQMLDQYHENLRQLSGLKIDYGRRDEFAHIPPSCKTFSLKLSEYNIEHQLEGYEGNHVDQLAGRDGRVVNQVLPFFEQNFLFEK